MISQELLGDEWSISVAGRIDIIGFKKRTQEFLMICWMKWGEIEKRKNEKLGKWERETDQEGSEDWEKWIMGFKNGRTWSWVGFEYN